jgi:hypothetical protein
MESASAVSLSQGGRCLFLGTCLPSLNSFRTTTGDNFGQHNFHLYLILAIPQVSLWVTIFWVSIKSSRGLARSTLAIP